MKRIGENHVAEKVVPRPVVNAQGGIHLKIAGDVAHEADGGRVFRAALEIGLDAQGWIEIVGASQDRLVLVTGVNGA
jgi:hypothetical protein